VKVKPSTPKELDLLPFEPFTETLQSIIRKKYITRVYKWLQGKHDGSILAEESNSNWECALTIMFFIDIHSIFDANNEEKEFCEKVPSLCADVARHLILRKIVVSPQFVCWDRVTWDTAVVVKALLKTLKSYPDKFSDGDKKDILNSVYKAMHWLFMRFEKWETEVKYPFGPADVAQILITTVYLKENFPVEYQKILKEYSFKNKDTHIEEEICRYLIQRKETIKRVIGEIEERTAWWGDFYQTAETLESLAIYYSASSKSGEQKQALMNEIENTSKEVFRFIEHNQSEDGMWGTHVDTLRTLYVYIKATKLLPFINSEPHLVFKALRWICDEKQCFDDGSFLHTMFLTIFMCEAFVEVHNSWPLSKFSIAKVYDDVLWESPMRTSPERTRRFVAEMDVQKLSVKLKDTQSKLSTKDKVLFTVSITFITSLVIFFVGILSKLLSINVPDLTNFIALVSLILLIYTTILMLRWSR
jgi:hypothetical protein